MMSNKEYPPPEEVGNELEHEQQRSSASPASASPTGSAAPLLSTPPGNTTNDNSVDLVAENDDRIADQFAFRSVATVSSPWQYDDTTNHCTNTNPMCHREFTAMVRRHHCRLCGKVFCHDCSQWRALIPPSSIVLVPTGGKKVKPPEFTYAAASGQSDYVSFQPPHSDDDPDRMLTYVKPGTGAHASTSSSPSNNNNAAAAIPSNSELLYGKGLEERFLLAREPLRVCWSCKQQLEPLQEQLRNSNSHAVRFNHIDPTDARRFFNSPIAFTLGHEIRKAAYTLNNLLPLPRRRMGGLLSNSSGASTAAEGGLFGASFLTGAGGNGPPPTPEQQFQQCRETCASISPNLAEYDGVRIPARLVQQAKGIAVLTVIKTGFGLAGMEFGTGLVVARLSSNTTSATTTTNNNTGQFPLWSAPSAIGTAGLSWGALVGAQVSDHVFLLMTDAAVELLFSERSVQLGADIGLAMGPLGRAAEADLGAAVGGKVAPIYTYSVSKGLYAGVSLDGKVLLARPQVNERFYGRPVSAQEILNGQIPTPPAAQPLYEALQRCHVYAQREEASRTAAHHHQQQQQQQNLPNNNNNNLHHNAGVAGTAAGDPSWLQTPHPTSHHLKSPDLAVTPPSGDAAAAHVTGGTIVDLPPPKPKEQQQQGVPLYGSGGTGEEEDDLIVEEVDVLDGEYGELIRPRHPPAAADQHSYAGMSDITSDPGY